MTSEDEYRDEKEYQIQLLKELRDTAHSIDEKVDDIRDEITEFFQDYRHDRGEWDISDLGERRYRG